MHSWLNQRARLAQQAGISKHADGHTVDFYRPEREAEVLRRALERNRGPLRNEEIARLFREIMSACLAQEEPLKVAFLGPEGTFTQTAVFKHFGHSVRALALATVDEVFQEVESGNADFGVVAIENSSEGMITNTLDRFLASPLRICGEVELRIEHCLMGQMRSLGEIFTSSPLDDYLLDAERVPVASNAEGARRARDEHGTAGIAGETAAQVYGLNVLAREIEDRTDNSTRFLVLGSKLLRPSGADRTTLLLSARDTQSPGALQQLLEPFARAGINMSRIESRPSRRRKWDYVFFIDIDGHAEDAPVRKALAVLKRRASLLRVLGSYPRAVI